MNTEKFKYYKGATLIESLLMLSIPVAVATIFWIAFREHSWTGIALVFGVFTVIILFVVRGAIQESKNANKAAEEYRTEQELMLKNSLNLSLDEARIVVKKYLSQHYPKASMNEEPVYKYLNGWLFEFDSPVAPINEQLDGPLNPNDDLSFGTIYIHCDRHTGDIAEREIDLDQLINVIPNAE